MADIESKANNQRVKEKLN